MKNTKEVYREIWLHCSSGHNAEMVHCKEINISTKYNDASRESFNGCVHSKSIAHLVRVQIW